MRVQKRRAQSIETEKILTTKIRSLKEEDKFKYLGNKICKFVRYCEQGKGRVPELAALADVLFSVKEILRIYDERFKELEKLNLEHQEINETGGINSIKIVLDDPNKKEEIV